MRGNGDHRGLNSVPKRGASDLETGLAVVTLVGNQLTKELGVCNDVFSRLGEHAVRMICHGASHNNLCFLLPGDAADSAVKALHHRLFE